MTTTILMPQGTTYSRVILSDGPVAYYKLSDGGATAADSSPNGFDGTYVNSPSTTTSIVQNTDDALSRQFLGSSSQYVTIPDDPALRPGNGSWTLECWANVQDVNQLSLLVGKRIGGPTFEQVSMGIASDSGGGIAGKKMFAQFQETNTGNIYRYAATSFDVTGSIRHFVMVADKDADTIHLYVNGALDGAASKATQGVWPTVDITAPYRIAENNGGLYLTAVIDEVAIYNYALTASQVARHYVSGA